MAGVFFLDWSPDWQTDGFYHLNIFLRDPVFTVGLIHQSGPKHG